MLTRLAQEARRVRLALDGSSAAAGLPGMVRDFERVLSAMRLPVLTAALSAEGAQRA